MAEQFDDTKVLRGERPERAPVPRAILNEIYAALQEKGYDPIRQIASYLLTGEPAYITAHRNARSLAAKLERDEVVEELVRAYLERREASGGNEPPVAGAG